MGSSKRTLFQKLSKLEFGPVIQRKVTAQDILSRYGNLSGGPNLTGSDEKALIKIIVEWLYTECNIELYISVNRFNYYVPELYHIKDTDRIPIIESFSEISYGTTKYEAVLIGLSKAFFHIN